MTLNQLAAKLAALRPEQRHVIESLVEILGAKATSQKPVDLEGHSSFGAWAGRQDVSQDADELARDLRAAAVRRSES